ncbi:MAG: ThuA domain-containing protein, partial [Bacteroidia bacterium]|nr:ThuA domain-containing protein [Bacteroidia bacterium]
NGDNHPITWYREFDGGRTWYTGLGHTDECFQDNDFLEMLWGGIQFAAGPGVPVNYNNARVAPEENRFQKVVLDFNLNEPMELDMLPNEDILFIERKGAIKTPQEVGRLNATGYNFSCIQRSRRRPARHGDRPRL